MDFDSENTESFKEELGIIARSQKDIITSKRIALQNAKKTLSPFLDKCFSELATELAFSFYHYIKDDARKKAQNGDFKINRNKRSIEGVAKIEYSVSTFGYGRPDCFNIKVASDIDLKCLQARYIAVNYQYEDVSFHVRSVREDKRIEVSRFVPTRGLLKKSCSGKYAEIFKEALRELTHKDSIEIHPSIVCRNASKIEDKPERQIIEVRYSVAF